MVLERTEERDEASRRPLLARDVGFSSAGRGGSDSAAASRPDRTAEWDWVSSSSGPGRLAGAVAAVAGSLGAVGGVSPSGWLPAAAGTEGWLLAGVWSARRDGAVGAGRSDGGTGSAGTVWPWRTKGSSRSRRRAVDWPRTRRCSLARRPSPPSAPAALHSQRPATRPTSEQTTAQSSDHHSQPTPPDEPTLQCSSIPLSVPYSFSSPDFSMMPLRFSDK